MRDIKSKFTNFSKRNIAFFMMISFRLEHYWCIIQKNWKFISYCVYQQTQYCTHKTLWNTRIKIEQKKKKKTTITHHVTDCDNIPHNLKIKIKTWKFDFWSAFSDFRLYATSVRTTRFAWLATLEGMNRDVCTATGRLRLTRSSRVMSRL